MKVNVHTDIYTLKIFQVILIINLQNNVTVFVSVIMPGSLMPKCVS